MSEKQSGVGKIVVISLCLAAIAHLIIGAVKLVISEQQQATAKAASTAPAAPPPSAPAQVAAQAVNCEKYGELMRKCVSDFQLVRTALDAADVNSAPPSEERYFEALNFANLVVMTGTCIDILMWQIAKDTPGAPESFDVVMPYMKCPSTRLAMEHDARMLEQWHVVETRAAERCGSAIPCEVCKRSSGASIACVGIRSPESRLVILQKGTAFRTILSATR